MGFAHLFLNVNKIVINIDATDELAIILPSVDRILMAKFIVHCSLPIAYLNSIT